MKSLKFLNFGTIMYFIIVICCLSTKIMAQVPDTANSYELKFWDDFNGSSIDTSKWASNAHYGNRAYKHNCPPPNEPPDTIYGCDYYTPNFENIEFTGTSIKLVSKKEPGLGYYGSTLDTSLYFRYTTARLFSKWQFRYGYFEICLKIPDPPSNPDSTYRGISSNFWMYEARDTTGIAWSELDGYEIDCENNRLTNNVHFGQTGDTVREHFWNLVDPLLFNQTFDTLSFEWNADSLIYYWNGKRLRATNHFINSLIAMPIYIDMNVDHNQFCKEVDTIIPGLTIFPYKVEIDYIRVYQRKIDTLTNKVYCGDINTHNFTTYKSITADGGLCTDLVTNKTSFPMEAFDYVLLNPGFTASSTSMLYLNTMKSLTGQDYSPETHIGIGYVAPPSSWFERLKLHY